MRIIGHTSFLGFTGYNNHSRNFFRELSKLSEVHIRNYTHVDDLSYLTKEESALLKPYTPKNGDINIVLNESNHYYFYDKYTSPMIAYNVWESTLQMPSFFNRLLEYDYFWCPTQWQADMTIAQGYPADRVKVVPEAVSPIFKPGDGWSRIKDDTFYFMIFGRWDPRKYTTEMIRVFNETFKDNKYVKLVLSIENPFNDDKLSTVDRLKKYNLTNHEQHIILDFPPREEYVKWLQHGHCLLSCSRAEGWNLPLTEAMACGTPVIYSDWGVHTELADGIGYPVKIEKEVKPFGMYHMDQKEELGVWCEPDYEHLKSVMKNMEQHYDRSKSLKLSRFIRNLYTWENSAAIAKRHLDKIVPKYISVPGMELYQDQYLNGEVVVEGKRECSTRYDAMKTVFEKYERPFTILDIGANFGYYSIKAAEEYGATTVMIESEDKEVETLLNICEQNECRDKLTVIKTRLDLYKLKEISKCEHFDVILGLNIIHHFKTDEIVEICETLTKMGDHLILETPPVKDKGACGQNNLQSIVDYFNDKEKTKLGEFKRHTSNSLSEMFWLETNSKILEWTYYEYEKLFDIKDVDVERLKNRDVDGVKCVVESDFKSKKLINPRKKKLLDWIPGINLKTFIKLNGVYPSLDVIIQKLQDRSIVGNYKWDNSNKDIISHNFILNGTDLHIIDYDDSLIGNTGFDDQSQLDKIISELRKVMVLTGKSVKINLGCGNDYKEGYINVDKYNNTNNVDYQWDLGKLEVEDKSIDEIYLSHVFEHIEINTIYSVLNHWNSKLKHNGRLVIRVPNLEWEIKLWLNSEDKWKDIHRIYGSQSHEGNAHSCGFTKESLPDLVKRFGFDIESVEIRNKGYGEEIKMVAIKNTNQKVYTAGYVCHFVDGPFLQINNDPADNSYYSVDFVDPDANANVHQQLLTKNTWTRPYRRWYTNWEITVKKNGVVDFSHKFDPKNKRVLISLDSKGIGDTLAWLPAVEEFRKQKECQVIVSTFWNKLFKDVPEYSKLKFVEPGISIPDLYASYKIGCFDGDVNKNKVNWRICPLQKVAFDTLGIKYDKEIVAKIGIKPGKRIIKDKYVTISEHSTFQAKYWNREGGWQAVIDYLNEQGQAKYWNREGGWQAVIDYLNEQGYKVMVISKEATKLKNIIDMTNKSIEESITNIFHSEFFIGVSSGPTWISWSLKVPVVMISGYSDDYSEMKTGVKRIINKSVCNSCFNDDTNEFDRGSWLWCPRNNDFECTKEITEEKVIKAIEEIRNEQM